MKYQLLVAICVSLATSMFACTKPNPEVCCVSAEDCSSIGVTDSSRGCALGLTCQDHSCVTPSCTTSADCSGATPVCTDGTCVACDAQNVCSTGDVCKSDGSCVQCVMSSDCDGSMPVCDLSNNMCRSCQLDSECASGACADDGTCVAEENIVYLDPNGTGAAGTCTRTTPCPTLSAGIKTTNTVRNHIVLATGSYTDSNASISVDATQTSAQTVIIHGANSTLNGASLGEPLMNVVDVATVIQDVTFSGGTRIQNFSAPVTIVRSKFTNMFIGLVAGPGLATLQDDEFVEEAGGIGIRLETGSHLKLDRAVLHGGANALAENGSGGNLDVTNMMVFGTSGIAANLPMSSGAIKFSTIAGAPGTTAALSCNMNIVVQSSLIWNLGSSALPVAGTCSIATSFAGPGAIAGVPNTDPQFANPAANDYHLQPGSPAVDFVTTGPTTDFEGDARPQGMRYDIGADEVKQ